MNPALSLLEKLFGQCPPDQMQQLIRALLAALPPTAPPQGQPSQVAIQPTVIPFLKTVSGVTNGQVGDTEVLPGIGDRSYHIMAYALSANYSAGDLLVTLHSGSSATDTKERWRMLFRSPTNVSVGANLSTSYPSSLFHTEKYAALILRVNAAASVHYSFTYWEARQC